MDREPQIVAADHRQVESELLEIAGRHLRGVLPAWMREPSISIALESHAPSAQRHSNFI
jgi:hypothetical protein